MDLDLDFVFGFKVVKENAKAVLIKKLGIKMAEKKFL